MAKTKKEVKEKVWKGKKTKEAEKIPYAVNPGRVMSETGIIGDGALVKKAE